jgi:Na+-transporting methylmalonyl-CoA/oxaloacetate decarboxylase gamma subunit
MNQELFKDGCLIMLIGMGSVFIFIQLMVWFMQINTKIIEFINKKFPEPIEDDQYNIKKDKLQDGEAIALAIACAIREIKQLKG